MKILRVLQSHSAVMNRLFISAILIFLFIGVSEATTYYVDKNCVNGCSSCSDSASGTSWATAFCTIQKCANIVNPGDICTVANGVYNEINGNPSDGYVIVRTTRGGTSGSWVTFRSQNTWGAKIDGQNSVDACVLFNYDNNAGYIRFEGFDIYNCCKGTLNASGDAIFINARSPSNCSDYHAHNIYLYKNKIHDVCRIRTNQDYGQAGVDMDNCTGPVTIDSNIFYNIGRLNPDTTPSAPESSCTVPYGYPFSAPSTGTCTNPNGCVFCYNHDPAIYPRNSNVTIINNIFYDIKSGWPICPWPQNQNITGLKIINNTFYGSNNHTSYHIALPNYIYKIGDATIQNNIFYSPRNAAIYYNSSGQTTVTVKNNLVYGAPLVGGTGCSASNYTCSGNITDQDPLFVNLRSHDFHLRSDSPAIDEGLSFPGRKVDADGNPIVGAPDIGAYEYGGDQPRGENSPPSPPSVTGIR